MAGTVPHLVLILGADAERQEAIGRHLHSVLGSPSGNWNVQRYYGDEFVIREFIEQASTRPLLGDRQVLLVKNVGHLPKSDQETLSKFFQQEIPFTWGVFEDETFPANSPLYQTVSKKGKVIRLEMRREKEGGLAEDRVTYKSFDLVDALSEKDVKKALEIFDFLYEREVQVVPEILGVLNWHFKRLWDLKRWSESGLKTNEMMSRLRIPYPFFERALRSANALSKLQLERIVHELFRLDWDIKQGNVEQKVAVETFLVTLCSSN
jgi:DNA polymerase III delta subunit